ncbi:MAG: hypothetical protein E7020_00005 [Alphaproteobacteria bacterium]|nr:hypothetical protein [Alphaproteobacteria bacterium]
MVFVDSTESCKRLILIVGYLDNSSKNISPDTQRDIVNQYAREKGFDIDVFFAEADIQNIKNNINSQKNTLIVANIACLGNKLATIVENIEFLVSNGFELISVKESLQFDNSKETKQLLNGVKLSIDIRNSMVSTITKKALKDKKDQGAILGFVKGQKCKSTILERNKYKIIQLYHEGKTKKQIAKTIGCSISLIFKYLQQYPELKTKMREI